ncbi:hypothetical protein RDWZM_008616 [Blomia tropicalis]|uniref:Uncharacterized protein n=1 Tax=Blomia tropicalis TaxID=40697 RepID=A0A9Q0M207_BLOTA|nr:hypothetical protein RDWZM_008616 [Blomia tropicalis]
MDNSTDDGSSLEPKLITALVSSSSIVNQTINDIVTSTITTLDNVVSIVPLTSNIDSTYRLNHTEINGTLLRSGVEEIGLDDSTQPSGTVMTAWIGLGILLVGIAFILGFVFVYDRIIKRKYFNKNGETDQEDDEISKSKKNVTVNDAENGPIEPKIDNEVKLDLDDSDKSLNEKRRRQEKEDENKAVELKPLDD